MDSRSPEAVVQDLEQACRALADSGLGWEWDSRFSAALAVVKDPQHHEVLDLVQAQLAAAWDYKSIRQAPGPVAELARAWGGLRPGQQMFTCDSPGALMLFAVWWPWGGDTTFSLRIGCVAEGAGAEGLDLPALIKRCFGLEG